MKTEKWKHLLSIDEPFDEYYWCPEEEGCSLCNERRERQNQQQQELPAANAEE